MHVVIFRAKISRLDAEYSAIAARMRDLALNQFGCLEFHSVTEGAKTRWYQAAYSVQVAEVNREYHVTCGPYVQVPL